MSLSFESIDLGVLPGDWDVSTVGKEFSIELGKMLDAARNSGTPKPYLGNRAVQWGRIDTSDLQLMPLAGKDLERYRLRTGDLLVCEGGEVGRAAIWDGQIEECYYQKALHRLRPKRGYEPRLLLAVLQEHVRNGVLADFVTQTSIAHLPREKFLQVPIPCPPPAEQSAIVDVLSDVDALVDQCDELISKKRALKQAVMQQLLTGQTRLPGFSGDWEEIAFGDVFSRINVKRFQIQTAEYEASGKYPIVDQSDQLVSAFSDRQDRLFQCPPGGIVVFGDHTCVVKFVDFDFVVGADGTQVLQAHAGQSARFHAYQLQHLGIASTGYNRHFRLLTDRMFAAPSLWEQNAIAAVLSDMDAELDALEARRVKTLALKQAMMQELLTGRTRLV